MLTSDNIVESNFNHILLPDLFYSDMMFTNSSYLKQVVLMAFKLTFKSL